MTYRVVKWTLFALLMLLAPALLFLIQVVMVLPAVFFAAGLVVLVPKVVMPSQSLESLTFMAFFGVHLLVFGGLYLLLAMLLAMLLAKLIALISSPRVRGGVFALVALALASLALLPVYGSGGHGSGSWGSLLHVLGQINDSYGPYAASLVYGAAILCLVGVLLVRRHRPNRQSP